MLDSSQNSLTDVVAGSSQKQCQFLFSFVIVLTSVVFMEDCHFWAQGAFG